MQILGDWFRRHFSDPQMVILAVLLIVGAVIIIILGHILAPMLAAVVIAYLLQGIVNFMERHRIPRVIALFLVFLFFVIFGLFLLLMLLPLLWQQVGQLFKELPSMITWSQQQLLRLPERFPGLISEKQVIDLFNVMRYELTRLGQQILSLSVASARVIVWILVYSLLVPILVFFFLKDKEKLLQWFTSFLPPERRLATEVWREVDHQIGNYVRGKFWEILIVWSASYVTFTILGLQFAMLISFFVGLSVLVPYIGATVMAFPVASIAYFQWGWSSEFGYAVAAYLVIQILDGNVLAPLLFSEVVNLHPIAIIVSILVFGGFFGFWGVFFAIPLATLVQALLKVWAGHRRKQSIVVTHSDQQGTG
jgi:putative permease